MDILEAIQVRHSVRAYRKQPLGDDVAAALTAEIEKCNKEGNLHIQLVRNEPKAFQGPMAKYGKFSGVTDYFVVAGQDTDNLDERAGYYGERLVLAAQMLGLNTCWVGLSYSKVPGTYVLGEREKIVCYISVGYGETQGAGHKTKTVEQVSNVSNETPEWFRKGVEAALLAPTAVNQQKFYFTYIASANGGKAAVAAKKQFSFVGYTHVDLGIAKRHFEIAAGTDNFEWAEK